MSSLWIKLLVMGELQFNVFVTEYAWLSQTFNIS